MPSVKSMPIFFLDNQGLLEEGSELIGNVVLAKIAPAAFPTYTNVGMAAVAGFNGMLVCSAGNNGILVYVFEGKTKDDWDDIRKALSSKPSSWPSWIHQYRISVPALLNLIAGHHQGEYDPTCAKGVPLYPALEHAPVEEKTILRTALRLLLAKPESPGLNGAQVFAIAEGLLGAIEEPT